MSKKNNEVISEACHHTIKKFELIEKYIEAWAQKLANTNSCKELVFIDCMCNSGVYRDKEGNIIYGTPIRVANILRDVAGQYPNKKIYLYFNDLSEEKINELKRHLPNEKNNFRMCFSVKDANVWLKEIGPKLKNHPHLHYFLFYDPYEAAIDWEALIPFFKNWGEVVINHMVSDSIRAVSQVKTEEAKNKYSDTYLEDFQDLLPYGSDRSAYTTRVKDIIKTFADKKNRNCYIASVPFFNSRNSLLYDIIHCTNNEVGFELFKETAWKICGGKSSIKDTHGRETQLMFDMIDIGEITTDTDESCFFVHDIAEHIQDYFAGREDVPLETVWEILKLHPVFPCKGYRKEIRKELKENYGTIIKNNKLTFKNRR